MKTPPEDDDDDEIEELWKAIKKLRRDMDDLKQAIDAVRAEVRSR